MQKENEREKELRLARRDYLKQLDEKLNASKSKTEKKSKKKKEPVIAEQEVNEASNEDALFSGEE